MANDNLNTAMNIASAAGTAAAPFTGGLSLALPLAQMIYGGFQSIKANKELKKLGNQDISYKGTPDSRYLLGLTRDNAQHGYSAAEKAAFLQTVAGNTARSYRLGMNRAGNSMSNAIGASNQIANSNAMNQFAAQDAQLQRSNQGVYAGQVAADQNRANQNTSMEFQQNNMGQRAYGQAANMGVNNIATGLEMGAMLLGKSSGTPPSTFDPQIVDYNYDVPKMNPNPMQYGLPYNNQGYQLPPDNIIQPVFRQNYRGLDYNNNIQMKPQGKSWQTPVGNIDWNALFTK